MKNWTVIVFASLTGICLVEALTFAAEQKPSAPAAVVARYSETLTTPKGTTPAKVQVEIKDLHFVRDERGVKLPAAGFYIAQLKSGQIDTEIAGDKQHRRAGDFWTVPAGQIMTVHFPAHSQAAQIRTIAVGPGK